MSIHNLILSGGQIRGISYVGVFKAIEELGLTSDIKNIVGVSSGAIFALLYSLGLNSDQMKNIVVSLSLDHLTDINTDNIFNIVTTFGVDNGDKISRIFKIIIKKILGDANATFADLRKKSHHINLMIAGSNLTTKQSEIFSADTTPDMPLHIAVRISISVPVYFNAVLYNEQYYIDGAFTNNYPINLFDDDIEHTLGIVITDSNIDPSIKTFGIYMYKVTDCVMSIIQNYFKKLYHNNTIEIFVTYDILEMRFDKEIKESLIQVGYSQFMSAYKKTSFNTETNCESNANNSDSETTQRDIVETMIQSLQEELNSNELNSNELNSNELNSNELNSNELS
jgi:predicted acylesterase/phospholipase RssA